MVKEIRAEAQLSVSVSLIPSGWESCWSQLLTQEVADLCGLHLPGASHFPFAAVATAAEDTNSFPWAHPGTEGKGAHSNRGDPWALYCSTLSTGNWDLSFILSFTQADRTTYPYWPNPGTQPEQPNRRTGPTLAISTRTALVSWNQPCLLNAYCTLAVCWHLPVCPLNLHVRRKLRSGEIKLN